MAVILALAILGLVGCDKNRVTTDPSRDQSDTRSLTRTHGVTNATNVGAGDATGASGSHSGGTFGSRRLNEPAGAPRSPSQQPQGK